MRVVKSSFVLATVLAFSANLVYSGNSTDSLNRVQLNGRALFSFTPNHFMFQTDRYIYKISKEGLTPALMTELENASNAGKQVRVDVPRGTVEYLWPNPGTASAKNENKKFRKLASDVSAEAKIHDGSIHLRGQSLFSFSEPFYLVEVNENVYQIKKSALTESQVDTLSRAGIGSSVELDVPLNGVQLTWSYRAQPQRTIASVTPAVPADEVTRTNDLMKIRGTVLHSFDQPLVLVESKSRIYQIQRNKVLTAKGSTLDQPGSKVELTTPISAVEFIWLSAPQNIKFQRMPASVRP